LSLTKQNRRGRGGDGGGPDRPFYLILFLISLSICITWCLFYFLKIGAKTVEAATIWSAVYGSILGTIGFLSSRKTGA
jgi:hypothetical protein